VVRQFVGHGIGTKLHEEPEVPNFGKAGRGIRLIPGMTLAIEPMINMGTPDVKTLSDGWTVETADRQLSAHFEHTIAITSNGPVILTRP
jgi:methionyl aminopeptidase